MSLVPFLLQTQRHYLTRHTAVYIVMFAQFPTLFVHRSGKGIQILFRDATFSEARFQSHTAEKILTSRNCLACPILFRSIRNAKNDFAHTSQLDLLLFKHIGHDARQENSQCLCMIQAELRRQRIAQSCGTPCPIQTFNALVAAHIRLARIS